MSESMPTFAFFGHHKCATKWIMRIINNVCQHLCLNHEYFHSPKMWGYNTASKLYLLDELSIDRNLDFVSYISADKKYIGDIERFRGFHVIRDPRDIVVSAYYSHRYSHPVTNWPELTELRPILKNLPKDKGLLVNMDFTAELPIDGWEVELFQTMLDWDYSLPNIVEVKFEQLVKSPYKTFVDVFDFLGLTKDMDVDILQAFFHYTRHLLLKIWPPILPRGVFRHKKTRIPAWLLLYFVYINRFSKLSEGRGKGEENAQSHYRKGIPGDWRNHFNEEHKEYFKTNYNDLLIKLGYENDDNW